MVSKFWLGVALAAALCAGVAVYLFTSQPAAPVAVPASVDTAPATPVTAAAPAPVAKVEATRPAAGYDRYKAEMKRIRAARKQAQALEANERCIGGQRFRKVGDAWERAGNCLK